VSQQEISAASEVAVRKYKEALAAANVTMDGVAAIMRSSIKDSTDNYKKKLSKIVSVANPVLGLDWLHEVRFPRYSISCYN